MNRQLLHPGLHRLLSVVAVLCSLLGLSGLAEAAASYCTATYTINSAANNQIGVYNFKNNTIVPVFPAASANSNALAQSSANGNLYYIDRANGNFHRIDVNATTNSDTTVGTVNLPATLVGGTTDAAGNYYIYLANGSFAQVNVAATGNQTVTYTNFTVPTGYTLNNTTNGDFAIDSSGQTYIVAQVTAVPNGSNFAAGTFLWKLNLTSGALTSPVPFRTNANTQWAAADTANGLSIDPATGAALISTGTGDGTNGAGIYSISLTSGVTAFKVADTTLTDLGTCAVAPDVPTLTKSFSPNPVSGTPASSTLTITLGNTNKAPLYLQSALTDTLPTTPGNMVVATPNGLGGTCTTASVTATAGSGTITYASGAKIPAGGCTIIVNVQAPAYGSYTNTLAAGALDTTAGTNATAANATLDDLAAPTVTLNKTIANPGRINAADQFTVQIKNGATVTANASTTGTNTTATTNATTLTSGTSYTLTEIMAANSVSALTSYDTAISCTNTRTASTTTLPSGTGQSFTLTPALGDVISCTLTNTAKQADLSATKTSDKSTYAAGENVVYTVTASNAGPNPAGGAVVADTLPNQTLSLGWTCAASGGAACPSASGSGNVNQTIATFPSGGKVVYTITALARIAGTGIVNTATVTAPATVLDPATGNNTASATLAINAPAAGPAYPGPGPISKYATCLDFSNMPNLGAGQSYSSNVVTPDGITVYYTLNVTSVVDSAPGAATTTDAVGKYVPGTWQGDRWQQYFGAGKTNAIANVTQGRQAFYTLSAYAQIGTLAVPITLLTGSAEEDGQNNLADPARPIEYTQSTTNGTPFAVADVYTTGGAYRRVTVSNGGATESMTIGSLDGNGNLNQTNILLMATTKTNATSASPLTLTSSLLGGGITAQAFCASFSADRGDNPTSYGAANVLLNPTYGPGLSDGFRTLDQLTAGTRSDDTPVYLGAGKPSAEDVPRGTNGTGDTDDGVSSFAALSTASTTYSVTVAYNNTSGGSATLSGWIDFNRNGTFEAAEKASVTVAAGSGNATLTWTGLTGLVKGQSYARFRISTDAASAGSPTGTSPNGEVEDYPLTIQNSPPTTATVTNVVLLDTAAATVLNPNLSATDPDGTIATYTIVTLPTVASGVLALNGTAVKAGQTFTADQLGNLTFKPVAGFNGNASFTYSATDNDGATSNTSTYTIPVNVAPVANNDTSSTPANTAKTLSITGNDTDTAPGTVNVTTTLFATSGQPTGSTLSNGNRTIAVPNEGTYTLDNSGNVTFTPVAGYSGTTSAVKYTVQDNQGATSNVASITVTVTPVANNDTASTAPSALVNIPVLNNDLGTGKVATSVVFPTAGQPTGATVSNNGKTLTNADGTYTVRNDGTVDFTPALGKTGTLTPVLYTFKDAAGQTSNTATITVTVSAITPPTATNDSKTTPKNTAVTLEGSTNDTAGSLAIDNSTVVFPTAGQPGTATVSNGGKTLTVTNQGTYQVQTNGTVIFTPVTGYAGTTTPVYYTVKDTSGATSNAASLTVTVTNQPPVANNVTNTLVTSTAAAAALNPGVSGTDADGTVVSYTVTTLPTATVGTLYCNGTAITAAPSTCAPAQLSFKPNPTFNGNATFQYTVTDDNGATSTAATYTIPVNVPPVANNDSGATNPNVNVTFSVTGNDTDTAPGTVDVTTTAFDASSTGTISNGGKTLTVSGQGVFTLDNAGNVTFAPAAGFNNGTSTAKYTVKDNNGAVSNVATITVNVPASVDLAITKSGPAYFKPGDTLSYTLTVTNGGSAATGVTVTDTLPAGLTFVSASSGGTYNAGTGKVSWTVGAVANGATVTLTLTGTAPAAASVETNNGPTSLVNTATTQGNETEVVTTNNSATTTAQLVYPKLTKRVRNVTQNGAFGTVGTGKPTEVLEYCIDFKNYGVAVASFVVSDTVPSNTTANLSGYGAGLGLQVVRGNATTTRTSTGTDADGGSLSSAALSLDLGTLAAGESGSVCFQANIK